MKGQLDDNPTGVGHYVVNFVCAGGALDPEGNPDILDVLQKKGMDLIDVAVGHHVRAAVHTLLAYLADLEGLCLGQENEGKEKDKNLCHFSF